MSLDYGTLEALRRQHPAWRLLAAEHAPLVASFLHRTFIVPNVRVMVQTALVEALNDTLYGIHEQAPDKAAPKFPRSALKYLNDWAADDKGWLRKFYPPASDEVHFDLTPATERALAWLTNLSERAFVGTEPRLLADAFALIGKAKDAARFAELVRATQSQQPAVLAWLQKRSLRALELHKEWPRLLGVVAWLKAHPRPGRYLRQVDIAGVDSKFIESHRSVLTELFDLALPLDAIDGAALGAASFCQRFGFLDKPLRIRFRWLDVSSAGYGTDIAVTQTAFEQLHAPVSCVFITENEVNFLAFPSTPSTPSTPSAMVIFGGGFGGLERLKNIPWLRQCSVHYWGDIDTHGFAMLDQLRSYLPHMKSLLMDEATLMLHADHWGHEPKAQQRDLPRLTADERVVYDTLRDNRVRAGVRLEQERIGFGWVEQAIAALQKPGND